MGIPIKILIYLLTAVLLFSNPGWGEEKTFVIGVEQLKYYPLYSYEGEEYIGASRAVLDGFFKQYGYKFQYKILPILRLFRELTTHRLDFKYPDSPFWQQAMKKDIQVTYSDGVLEYIDGTMVIPDQKGKRSNLKTLGSPLGFTPWAYIDQVKKKELSVTESTNFNSLLMMVIKNRVEGAYINIAVARHYLDNVLDRPGELVFDPSLPHVREFYQLSTTKHPAIIQEFNSYLKKNKKKIDQIKKKFKVNVDF